MACPERKDGELSASMAAPGWKQGSCRILGVGLASWGCAPRGVEDPWVMRERRGTHS